MFAKLYETPIGQILVKLDEDSDGNPEVRFYFQPEGLGVCSFSLGYDDDDEGWQFAENAFSEMTEEKAFRYVDEIKQSVGM